MPRASVAQARRVVVKVGSSSLTDGTGTIDEGAVDGLAEVLSRARTSGREIVLVSSGAIAAGFAPLGQVRRPRDLATQQAAASVGQGRLMHRYTDAFAARGVVVGQVLLTSEDVTRRAHYRNAQRTLYRLLELGALPIVNENDTVATDEIRFGDNDRLAALVSHLVGADLLVLLSDVDGLYSGDPAKPGTELLREVRSEEDLVGVSLGRPGRAGRAGVGTGGMTTKVEAARIATSAGVPVVLTSTAAAAEALAGAEAGTFFHATGTRARTRLLWLQHAVAPAGRLLLDPGAVRAVVQRRLSLLPAGVTAVEGDFEAGDAVDLVDADSGVAVARGLVNYGASELPSMLGRSTRELAADLGPTYEREVVHRDDLVLL
ncbi:MAG TPA: glutamate 5-kinase [Actinomycetes bacterium]|nr:glutamate 5-kinase [Actinomycetes bacterium]